MKKKTVVVSNKMGLHARPAARLVQALSGCRSNIKILKDDFEIDAKSIMGVMSLAAGYGSKLKFIVEGPDENKVLVVIEDFFKSNFQINRSKSV
jgi:phosphocarrier protein